MPRKKIPRQNVRRKNNAAADRNAEGGGALF
jgi:hypothetical protein